MEAYQYQIHKKTNPKFQKRKKAASNVELNPWRLKAQYQIESQGIRLLELSRDERN